MLVHFFFHLKNSGLPVTVRELLDLVRALDTLDMPPSIDAFYQLSRLILVKEERFYDRFDRAYGLFINGEVAIESLMTRNIPAQWLEKMVEKHLTDEEKAQIESLGGFEELIETFKKRMAEQKGRHQGGNKWIGTGGTSPFGAYGYNPEGFRIGQDRSRHQRAVKVWDKREFANLDDEHGLVSRNMSQALNKLRKRSVQGIRDEFNLDDTIVRTAKNAGWLELCFDMRKHSQEKVLILFDIGGSMDFYVELSQQLFFAAKSTFKQLQFFYFHNCVYEKLWLDNHRRQQTSVATMRFLEQYDQSYELIIVGDAAMSPYEILHPGGSVEHMNKEAGEVWLKRLVRRFPKLVWLNPLTEDQWYAQSQAMINDIINNRMYPMTLQGIEQAMTTL